MAERVLQHTWNCLCSLFACKLDRDFYGTFGTRRTNRGGRVSQRVTSYRFLEVLKVNACKRRQPNEMSVYTGAHFITRGLLIVVVGLRLNKHLGHRTSRTRFLICYLNWRALIVVAGV
jgi:hypothetical protein